MKKIHSLAACAALLVSGSAFAQTDLYSTIVTNPDGSLDAASTLIAGAGGGNAILSIAGDVTVDGDDLLVDGFGEDYVADTAEPFINLESIGFVGGLSITDAAGEVIDGSAGGLAIAFFDTSGDLFDVAAFTLGVGNFNYNLTLGDDFFIPSAGSVIFASLPDSAIDGNDDPIADADLEAVLFFAQGNIIGTTDPAVTAVATDSVITTADVGGIDDIYTLRLTGEAVSVIPEPATLGLAGLAALGLMRRRTA